jgi:hypothetical protein
MRLIIRETEAQVTPNDFYDLPSLPAQSEEAVA